MYERSVTRVRAFQDCRWTACLVSPTVGGNPQSFIFHCLHMRVKLLYTITQNAEFHYNTSITKKLKVCNGTVSICNGSIMMELCNGRIMMELCNGSIMMELSKEVS